jgi:hypothetical protein
MGILPIGQPCVHDSLRRRNDKRSVGGISVPNGLVGQVLSYGLVGGSVSEGWTRPE